MRCPQCARELISLDFDYYKCPLTDLKYSKSELTSEDWAVHHPACMLIQYLP